jgi:hypothetical protein
MDIPLKAKLAGGEEAVSFHSKHYGGRQPLRSIVAHSGDCTSPSRVGE